MKRAILTPFIACSIHARDAMHLTLGDARRIAIENNPQFGLARLTASAAHQVAPQIRASLLPAVTGLVTGVGADSGSRLAGFSGRNDTGGGDRGDGRIVQSVTPRTYGAAAVNVSIPIFNGGLFKARPREAEFRALAASKIVGNEANRGMRDVRIAYLRAQTAYERVGPADPLLRQAQIAAVQYQSGALR